MQESNGRSNLPDDTARSEVPDALERSEVPRYFRQFRDATVLKKLAHGRKGPTYEIIGRNAWYDTADIRAWLEARKSPGPPRPTVGDASAPSSSAALEKRQRGRPTKTEQRRRELDRQAAAA